MKAASKQEELIEALAAQSFGAQFLYMPVKYYVGKEGNQKEKEPYDLAWVVDGFVALFYCNESKGSYIKQAWHNGSGPTGFVRRWAQGGLRFALCGRNRFGDELCKQFSEVSHLLIVSVVSCMCAPAVREFSTFGKTGCMLIIPAWLIEQVAQEGGTIVDVLKISYTHLKHRDKDEPTDRDWIYGFCQLTTAYFSAAKRVDASVQLGHLLSDDDKSKIYEGISKWRAPAGDPFVAHDADTRSLIARVFCDFTLSELQNLVYAAAKVLEASFAPLFVQNTLVRVICEHYSFVVYSVNLGGGPNNGKNAIAITQKAIEMCKIGPGTPDAITICYASIFPGMEYRIPHLLCLPQTMQRPHSHYLIECLAKLAVGKKLKQDHGDKSRARRVLGESAKKSEKADDPIK